jgi:hypothetical protein
MVWLPFYCCVLVDSTLSKGAFFVYTFWVKSKPRELVLFTRFVVLFLGFVNNAGSKNLADVKSTITVPNLNVESTVSSKDNQPAPTLNKVPYDISKLSNIRETTQKTIDEFSSDRFAQLAIQDATQKCTGVLQKKRERHSKCRRVHHKICN